MKFVAITKENADMYKGILDADAAEHIGRSHYLALAMHEEEDHEPNAWLIWKLIPNAGRKSAEAELLWFYAKDVKSGKAILEECENRAAETDVTAIRFEFPVGQKETELAALKEMGYETREAESRDFVITVADLDALPIADRTTAAPNLMSIGELTINQFRKGVRNCLFRGRAGILEDLDEIPVNWFEPDVSGCVQIDGNVCGFLLVHKQPSKRLDVELLFAVEPASRQDMIGMIRFSLLKTIKNYSGDTQVLIRRCNDATRALTSKIFPEKKGTPVIIGEKQKG